MITETKENYSLTTVTGTQSSEVQLLSSMLGTLGRIHLSMSNSLSKSSTAFACPEPLPSLENFTGVAKLGAFRIWRRRTGSKPNPNLLNLGATSTTRPQPSGRPASTTTFASFKDAMEDSGLSFLTSFCRGSSACAPSQSLE